VKQDTFNRVYYLDTGVLRVTTTAGMSPAGGAPGSSWKAGVPKPTVAPALVVVDRSDLRDYPGATLSLTCWYESLGERFQEAAATLTTVTAMRSYTFPAPAVVTGTPDDAVLRATLKVTDTTGHVVMSVTMTVSDTDVRSSAMPGGVTLSMVKTTGLTHKIDLIWGVVETRAYTYTAKNTWNEESPPSPASQVSLTYLQDVQVTLSAVDFTGYRPLSVYKTYRTMGSSSAYLEIHSDSALTFTDTSSKAADVLGSLETLDYESPPALLDAMVRLANGCLVGFKGNMLYMSEAYRPHTWQYQYAFSKNIRGICAAAGSLVVTTADGCYLMVGGSPSTLQPMQLPIPQAGIAQRSMTNVDGGTIFASNDGLVTVQGSQASLRQSQQLFARDDWQTRYGAILLDASLRLAFHDGCLVGTSSSQALGFVLRLDEGGAGQLTQFNEQMDTMFQLPVADSLYYTKGASIYQFRGGTAYNYSWWSRDFLADSPINLGAGYINCVGSVTLTLYADGVQWVQLTLSTGYFRLPAGTKRRRWSVKLQGAGTVRELYLGRTMKHVILSTGPR
jgi:hypothetical protein